MNREETIRGKYRVLNPNRIAIDTILTRLKSMKEEVSETIEMIEDMVWNMDYEGYYEDAITSLRNVIIALDEAIDNVIELLEVEPPGW